MPALRMVGGRWASGQEAMSRKEKKEDRRKMTAPSAKIQHRKVLTARM
jgi:hypothetical protein